MTVLDAPPEVPAESPRRRRRWPWAAAAAVVLAAAAIAVVALRGDDDEPSGPAVTSELPDPLDASNDPDTAELAALLAQGRAATYHATYRTSGGADAAVEGTTLEVWRDGGRLRQDTTATIEGQAVQTSSFLQDGEAIVCSTAAAAATDGDGWACSSSTPTGAQEDGVFGSVHQQLAGSSVTARDAEVDGEAARCFAFSGPEGDGELCVTLDGVPASIAMGGVRIELADLEDAVPADAFDLPAEPVSVPPAG
jgi:hypothetical protein